jgi:stress responsive alpha/beta barrel protein
MSRILVTISLIAMAAFSQLNLESASAAEPTDKVLRHVVMYKFKDTATPEQVEQVVAAFAGLPKKIDTIVGFERGTNVSPEGKSEGFTHIFVVTFKDEAGRDAYLKHSAHDAYVQVVKDKREKVVVFDYWAEK